MRCMKRLIAAADFVVSLFGAGGILATLSLVIFIILDILSRILLFPLEGTAEVSELLLGAGTFLALGYAHQAGMHVRVTVFISRLPPRAQAITNTCVEVLTVAMFGLITWKAAKITYKLWQSQAATYGTIELPQWIGMFLATLGFFSLTLAVLVKMISFIGNGSGNRKQREV